VLRLKTPVDLLVPSPNFNTDRSVTDINDPWPLTTAGDKRSQFFASLKTQSIRVEKT